MCLISYHVQNRLVQTENQSIYIKYHEKVSHKEWLGMDITIRTRGYHIVTEGFHISTNIYVRDYPALVTKATTYVSLSNLELYQLFGGHYEIPGFMYIWGFRCQKEVSETWPSNYIPHHFVYLQLCDHQNISASSLIIFMKLEIWITSHCFGIVHETIICAVCYILTCDDKFLVLLYAIQHRLTTCRWLSARLWYLQYVSNGDTAVLRSYLYFMISILLDVLQHMMHLCIKMHGLCVSCIKNASLVV